jgi:hypothetical protein
MAHSRCAPKTAYGGTSPRVASASASATYVRGCWRTGAEALAEAKEATAGTATKVFQATSVVGKKIGSLADVIREKAPQEATVRTVATAVPILSVRGGPCPGRSGWWLNADGSAARGGCVCPPHRPDYRKIPTF